MFSRNLSTSVLGICGSRDLSYETASELCGISSRYFGSIAREKTVPSVNTLEKLCIGFKKSPNDLLGYASADEELSYRVAMQVEHYRRHPSTDASAPCAAFPVCPRCQHSIERAHQAFCGCCGQKLDWDFFRYATRLPEK